MSKRNAIIAAIVAILALATVPFVYAQGRHRARGTAEGFPFLFGRMEKIRSALDLSDPQVQQLQAIGAQLRDQNAPYREQLRGGMQAVAQTLLADPSDIAGAQAILDQQSSARKAMSTNTHSAC